MGMLTPGLAAHAKVYINAPSMIYWTASGIDRRLYEDEIVSSNLSRDSIDIEINLTISAALVGVHDSKGLLVASATVLATGTHTNALYIAVKVDGVIVASAYSTVVVAATTAGGGNTRKLLAIGDSNTASNTWITQTTTRDTADADYNLTKIGTKGSDPNKHEGVAGKTVAYFYSDVLSPFVFSGSFNFAQYLSTNSLTMAASDWVAIMLGTNDIVSGSVDSLVAAVIETMITQIDAMITNIQSAVSGCRILICPVIPASQDQDDFGVNYASGLSRDPARRNLHRCRTRITDYYDTSAKRSAGIFVATTGLVIDSSDDYANSDDFASVNAIHPDAAGLQRLGDAIWMQLKALE